MSYEVSLEIEETVLPLHLTVLIWNKPEETTEQMQVLQESIKRYKKFRRNQLLFNGTDPRPQLVKKASLHEPGFVMQKSMQK